VRNQVLVINGDLPYPNAHKAPSKGLLDLNSDLLLFANLYRAKPICEFYAIPMQRHFALGPAVDVPVGVERVGLLGVVDVEPNAKPLGSIWLCNIAELRLNVGRHQ
jgi:hypothetical protein